MTTAVVITAVLMLAGCTGSDVRTEPVPPTPTPSPTPTSTIDPRAQPAVSAYEAFGRAARNAERHPVAHDQKLPPEADFTKSSFDPFRAAYTSYIWGLAEQGVEFRGTPDVSNINVKAVDLEAESWPTVTLTDCQTGDGWDEYVIKTGKQVPLAGNGKVPPPYLITAEMIYFDGRWGVRSVTTDKSRTCTA